jgi:hypothetical protein
MSRKRKEPETEAAPPSRAVARLERELQHIEASLEELVAGDAPILVGPFAGEVGYELLYWIPFVRWVGQQHPELKTRMIVVSRGGTRSWYGDLAADYLDLFDIYSPSELMARREAIKQRRIDTLDNEVIALLSKRHKRGAVGLLHPSLLYNLYYRLVKLDERIFAGSIRNWAGRLEGVAAVYEPFAEPPSPSLVPGLPNDYVAVRFYFRSSFPDTARNRRFARDVIRTVADRMAVVLLNNRMELDDHRELSAESSVITVDHLMKPSNNLHVQTAILSGAKAFVGTSGGLAYLPPHLGVPSLGFASLVQQIFPWHERLARTLFDEPGFAPFVSLRPKDLELLQLVIGSADGTLPARGSADRAS